MKSSSLKYFLIGAAAFLLLIIFILFPPEWWTREVVISLSWMVLVAFLLWIGNRLIALWLDRKFSWLEYGKWRFLTQLIIILVYSLGVVNGAYFLFKIGFTGDPPVLEQLIVMNVYGTFIIVLVSSLYFLFYFIRAWIKSQVETERLQKESVRSQLNVLRNHLDPHFLFNNLNILSALIDKDTNRSQEFLSKFTDVYRVLLKTETKELIPLQQELEFMEAYLHLIKIRFGDLFLIKMEINERAHHQFLPPLTLQMLVENGMKHNKMTEVKPLEMLIKSEGDFLLVSNRIQPLEKKARRSGSGLDNLKKRYAILSDIIPEVIADDNHFSVKIPLIEVDPYENPDS